ncbi:hypothetical protein [Anaerosinus sp.]|uniref:hypothetical protein n=1 Tax=Selenobaculum sp. TaxID=3074374 RepID=UPI0015A8A350
MDTTVMGLGICIIGVIVIAVIKYQGMKYNYKAVASVLLQELLVKEHGIKSDLANRVCTEIYKVKKNDFENTYSVAKQGSGRLGNIFAKDNLQKLIIEKAEKLNVDHNDSQEFNRINEIVIDELIAQLSNKKIKK